MLVLKFGLTFYRYLIRVSETGPGYALSVKDERIVRNYKISVQEDLTYITPNAPRPFVSLQDLIDHYHTDLLTEQGLTLIQPLPRPTIVESSGGIEYAQVSFEDGTTILMAPGGDSVEVPDGNSNESVYAASQELLAMATVSRSGLRPSGDANRSTKPVRYGSDGGTICYTGAPAW